MSYYIRDKFMWFRLWKFVLIIKHITEPMLFSERNGYVKYYRIGQWKFRIEIDG